MYKPFPELKIEWSATGDSFRLSCPWVSLEVEPDDAAACRVQTRGGFASAFLENFREFPLAYEAPRALAEFSAPEVAGGAGISAAEGGGSSLSEVLDLSRIEGTVFFDPLTVYGLLQRMRLVEECQESSNLGIYEQLDQLRARDEAAFFSACAKVIAQTLYITSRCNESLSPALEQPDLNRAKVAHFIESERGHDGFALRALKHLGFTEAQARGLPVYAETVQSMHELRASAGGNALAFCSLVGLFEGNPLSEQDPLAAILQRSSRPEAALGLEAHFRINRNEGHAFVGRDFVSDLPPVTAATVAGAVRASERCVRLGLELTRKLSREMRS